MFNQGTSYCDEAGRPRVRESVVGFFDILGFSQVSLACDSSHESQSVLDKIAAAIDDSRDFVRRAFADDPIAQSRQWGLKFFSDNLVLGYPIDEDSQNAAAAAAFIIRCAERYQLGMAMNGYFVRGALTQGLLCLTDEIIFGSALIESYQLESKASIVPRVVITEQLQHALATRGSETAAAPTTICRDVDGWWFVNYLQAALSPEGVRWDLIERHKASVLNSLSRTTRHDVLPKFGWTCRYHNVFCHWHRDDPGYSDDYRIDRADEQSTIHCLQAGELSALKS